MNILKKETITLENGPVTGYRIDLGNAPLLILQAKKGYIMCGYLNMAAANKLGDIAARVTGVKSFSDMLDARIVEVSEKAIDRGLHEGMTGKEFLNTLF